MWTNKTNMRSNVSWLLLLIGILKWNIDAFSNGKLGRSRICSVLKDHEGKFLCIFSCSAGNIESNEAEVLTIQKAMLLSIVFLSFYKLIGYGVKFLPCYYLD